MQLMTAVHAQEFITLRSGNVYAMCRCGWTGRTHGYVLRSQAVTAYKAHKQEVENVPCSDHFIGAETLRCATCGYDAATRTYSSS